MSDEFEMCKHSLRLGNCPYCELDRLRADNARLVGEVEKKNAALASCEKSPLNDFAPDPYLELLKKAFWIIMFYTDKNHPGDCVFTDKAQEGCYLCKEAEQKAWPEIQEITQNIKNLLQNENKSTN